MHAPLCPKDMHFEQKKLHDPVIGVNPCTAWSQDVDVASLPALTNTVPNANITNTARITAILVFIEITPNFFNPQDI